MNKYITLLISLFIICTCSLAYSDSYISLHSEDISINNNQNTRIYFKTYYIDITNPNMPPGMPVEFFGDLTIPNDKKYKIIIKVYNNNYNDLLDVNDLLPLSIFYLQKLSGIRDKLDIYRGINNYETY